MLHSISFVREFTPKQCCCMLSLPSNSRSTVVAGLLEGLSTEFKIRSERAWNSSQVQEQYIFEAWRVTNYEDREIFKRNM